MEEDKYVVDEKRAAAYVQLKGLRCPYCGSTRLASNYLAYNPPYQPIHCNECGSNWQDINRIVGIKEESGREIIPVDPEIIRLRSVLKGIYDLAEASMRDLSVDAWLIVNQISVLSNVAFVSKEDHEIQN